jgi:hypothetical protein
MQIIGGADEGRKHMFDKVLTPSDVGKLNRLVIPKQHAEKYFSLDKAANEKGLLLSFEDRGGKLWRFRYSYWSSSQTYVMTMAWCQFVKEKHLYAGDTVSFSSDAADATRFFIDWKCRAEVRPMPNLWGMRGISHADKLPPQAQPPLLRMEEMSMTSNSVPLVDNPTAAAKRVRLFGVDLDSPHPHGSERSHKRAADAAASESSAASSSLTEAHSSLSTDLDQ